VDDAIAYLNNLAIRLIFDQADRTRKTAQCRSIRLLS